MSGAAPAKPTIYKYNKWRIYLLFQAGWSMKTSGQLLKSSPVTLLVWQETRRDIWWSGWDCWHHLFHRISEERDLHSPPGVLQMEGEETGMGEFLRRGSERGLLEADLEEDEEERLGDRFATPSLQPSPSWSTSPSRINSYMVMTDYDL